MKVAELEGIWLDVWVARAEGRATEHWGVVPRDAWYSTRWEIAGPIIERERITVQASHAGDWRGYMSDGQRNDGIQKRGDTPLIAAMRAYVASKFGDEVFD